MKMRKMPQIEDPTQSRTLRDRYNRVLKGIHRRFLSDVLLDIKSVLINPVEIFVFSNGRSFSSGKLIQSLRTNITLEEREVITMAIRAQAVHGVKLALRQTKTTRRFRGVLGQFINEGTFEVLKSVNVNLVKSIQQDSLDKLSLLIARLVGGGTLTWNQFKKGIKKLGLGKLTDNRISMIARTEVIRTISTIQKETLQNLGKKTWRWITRLDERVCPFCGPLHGKTVKIGESFRTFRGNVITQSPLHPFCRCGLEVVE
jgi:SPP1 gp7 family putative phage head morphogenesis protein